jgi:hypothetical protein
MESTVWLRHRGEAKPSQDEGDRADLVNNHLNAGSGRNGFRTGQEESKNKEEQAARRGLMASPTTAVCSGRSEASVRPRRPIGSQGYQC